jgi:hypothetical protein
MPSPRLVRTIKTIAAMSATTVTRARTAATALTIDPSVIDAIRCASDRDVTAWAPAPSRALRLADSTTHRARLMLPSGRWSGSAFSVTSIDHASHSPCGSSDLACSVSRPTV